VFVDWLRTFADPHLARATPEELWEFRNSLLHTSNTESWQALAGEVASLSPYVGAPERPISADTVTKYIHVHRVIEAVETAIQWWIALYNEHEKTWPNVTTV
jgi:hypothetical protein